jgi:hypothetical protein
MCLAVIHVSPCSRYSSLASQVWETKCILKWDKGDILAWLEKKGWSEHISSLKLSDGEVLAARSLERLVRAVKEEEVALDLFTAVGLVLNDHNRKFDIDTAKFADIIEARGTTHIQAPIP